MRALVLTLLVFAGMGWTLFSPFVGVLLWHWLSLMNPHRMTWGFLAGLPVIMMVAVVTLLAWLLSKERKIPPLRAPTFFFLLLTLSICVSTLFAVDLTKAAPKWQETMKIFVMVVVTMAVVQTFDRIKILVWVAAASIGFYGVKGAIFSILTGGSYRVWGPPETFIQDNNAMGLALVMVIPLWVFLYHEAQKRWVKLVCAGTAGACVLAGLLTYSRGTLLGLMVLAFLIWLRSKSKLITGTAVALVLFAGLPALPSHWWERMASIQTYEQDDSAVGRLRQWHLGTLIARDHLLGGGFKVFLNRQIDARYSAEVGPGDVREAHSIYFQILGEQGFLGLGFFLALGISTFLGLLRVARDSRIRPELAGHRRLAQAIFFSLCGYAVSGAFLSLAYFDLYYLLVAISVGLMTATARARALQPAMAPLPAPARPRFAPVTGNLQPHPLRQH